MTEYHNLINSKAYLSFKHSSLWGKFSMVNLVTCLFSLFGDAFEVQIFRLGLIFFTPYQRH